MGSEHLATQCVRLSDIALQYIAGGTPSSKCAAYWDGDVPWTTSAAIAEGDLYLTAPQRYITKAGLQHSSTNIVPNGSIIVGTRVGVGKAVVTHFDTAISQDLTGVIIDPRRADSEFIAFQFKLPVLQSFISGRKRGTTIQGIARFDLEQVPLNVPPLAEQRAIASVLRAVQEALNARRRELDLERERKVALTTHFFTYGTTAKSENTRVTEFGEVPARWLTMQLSDCAYVQTGVAKGRRFANGIEVPYLRVANVQDGYLDLSEIKMITIQPHEIDRFRLQTGDVLLTEGGDFDKLGRGFVWTGDIPDCVHQNHVFAVRVYRELLLPRYFAYLAGSAYGKAYFLSVAHKTTNLACINTTKLKAFPVLLPPIQEQEVVSVALSKCNDKIAALQNEIALHDELFRALLEELMSGRLSTLSVIGQAE